MAKAKQTINVSQKAVISRNDGKILAVRRSKTHPTRAFQWDLPGGDVAYGEPLERAIAREVKEETGLEVRNLAVVGASSCINDRKEFWVTVAYAAIAKNGNVTLSWEHDAFQWVAPAAFAKLRASARDKRFVRCFADAQKGGKAGEAKIVSACLLGIPCRYDGKEKGDKKVIALSKKELLVPVCPEQLGGLATPRERSAISGNRVVTESGRDVTKNCKQGAKLALLVAKRCGAEAAILKQGSPSCGNGRIHASDFSGRIVKGDGVTAALLKKNGIKVISEEDI